MSSTFWVHAFDASLYHTNCLLASSETVYLYMKNYSTKHQIAPFFVPMVAPFCHIYTLTTKTNSSYTLKVVCSWTIFIILSLVLPNSSMNVLTAKKGYKKKKRNQ
eukprot:TRINITY_DN74101_c0_g1_i1.p1 TRINITY_DN74101_c0_g1~~TRINITY_DN74101_c0_g1_i1.p1  ORF type:complete len:105 (-),score=3.05 TRINITY_DN74101_c0_g1_i1:10-324(-)